MSEGSDVRSAPAATLRNRQPILAVLRRVLPASGLVLEIAAGGGDHAAFFAPHFPRLTWQPTDLDPAALGAIADATAGLANVRPPLRLDVRDQPWAVAEADAIVAINMIHIAPWACGEALLRGAARVLRPPRGVLYLYGPYRMGGRHTAPSNAAFDAALRERDPAWGVRSLDDVVALAEHAGLAHVATIPMPANNQSVLFRRE